MSRWVRDREKYERDSKWFCDWHRDQGDHTTTMIDLDAVGYCHKCWQAIYLVEATDSKRRKCAAVTENLGEIAGLEVFVFYRDLNRPDEFLVDHRSAGVKPTWMTRTQAWDVLMSVRRTHQCLSFNAEAV